MTKQRIKSDKLKILAALISNFEDKPSQIEISICTSPKSPVSGTEIGVKISHIKIGIIVRSIDFLPNMGIN